MATRNETADPSNRDFAIWWLSEENCRAIGEDDEIPLLEGLPEYIVSEYRSRLGRPGHGRLWTPESIQIPFEGIPWDASAPLSSYLREKCGGIVIQATDIPLIVSLPGCITDVTCKPWVFTTPG